ncbi:MAG: hypothetical protein OQK12_04870 [Motiliproteus sp.]|nr:hypothetical protein [Motiliproteus sp.]MCW9051030.1 hypothetical protein [Motiliproteus sp.]
MSYIINAWLEQPEPTLQVTSRITGQLLVSWKGERVRRLIDTGELDVNDLCSNQRDTVELVRELVMLSYDS